MLSSAFWTPHPVRYRTDSGLIDYVLGFVITAGFVDTSELRTQGGLHRTRRVSQKRG